MGRELGQRLLTLADHLDNGDLDAIQTALETLKSTAGPFQLKTRTSQHWKRTSPTSITAKPPNSPAPWPNGRNRRRPAPRAVAGRKDPGRVSQQGACEKASAHESVVRSGGRLACRRGGRLAPRNPRFMVPMRDS
jgi:hypothetical protein